MLLLVPDGADSILAKLEKSIRGDQNAKVDEVFGNNTKDDDETSRHSDDKTATPNGANTTPLTTLFPATAAAPPPSPATPSSSPVAGRRTSFVSFFQKRNAEVSSPTLNDVEEGIELEEGDEPDSPPISEEEFSDDDFDMEDDMEGVEDAPPPFELVCLDSVLQAATGILQGDFTTLEQKVLTAMEDLRGDHMNKNGKLNKKSHSNINATQDRLRVLKNEIAVLETRVSEPSKSESEARARRTTREQTAPPFVHTAAPMCVPPVSPFVHTCVWLTHVCFRWTGSFARWTRCWTRTRTWRW